MGKDLFFKAGFSGFLLLSLTFYYANSQITLRSFKDSTGKYGFKNQAGQIIIPAKYQAVSGFVNDLAAIKLNDKWGFINSTGKEVIPVKFQEAGSFSDGMARVKLNDKWGFIDHSGTEVIPMKYLGTYDFYDGLAAARLNNKWGFIDKNGKEVVTAKFQSVIIEFNEGLTGAQWNDKWGFIDKKGNEVIPNKYQSVENFNDGLAKVKSNFKWGFIDKAAKEIVPIKYQQVNFFKDGWAKVKLNDKWGAVDKAGNEIIPVKYDDVYSYIFSTGLGKVKLNDKWGAVDKAGNEVIAIKYEDLYPTFNEDLSTVKLNGKWGYIDRAGKEIVPFKYTRSWNFTGGFAQVELNGFVGYIDKTGREVIPVKYKIIHSFSEDLAAVQLNNKWGYVDKTGKEVIPLQYDYAHNFSGNKAQVQKNGQSFYISKPTPQPTTTAINAEDPTTTSSVKVLEPPVMMRGQIDASFVGAWKWQPRSGETGTANIYNFKNDGTYDFYIGNSMHPDSRSYKDVTLYWRVNGNTLETYCSLWKDVAKTQVEKRNDAATNKPAIVMQTKDGSLAFISIDNKPLFAGIPAVNLNTLLNNPPKDGHDPSILGLWKYNYPGTTNAAYIKLNADGSYESYNNSVSVTNRSDNGKCKWRIEAGIFILSCEGIQTTRSTIKKRNDPATGKPTLVLADYYPYFSMDNKAGW